MSWVHARQSGQRPLLVAADTRRPAAIQQLETLGKQPDRIVEEMRKFSDEFEKALQITPPEAPAGE